jgi:tRNA-binding protein
MIKYKDFENVEMHVGKIIEVTNFKEVRKPSYKLKIDFGEEIGIKKSSAQVTRYTKEELMGKAVIAVTNFEPKQIANFMSEVLVLGLDAKSGGIMLLQPDIRDFKLGSRVY